MHPRKRGSCRANKKGQGAVPREGTLVRCPKLGVGTGGGVPLLFLRGVWGPSPQKMLILSTPRMAFQVISDSNFVSVYVEFYYKKGLVRVFSPQSNTKRDSIQLLIK